MSCPEPLPSKVCRKCKRELPNTDEYFQPRTWITHAGQSIYLLGTCRRCRQDQRKAILRAKTEVAQAVKRVAGNAKWTPKVMGEDGPEGGYTEHPDDGYRFVALPDSHGDLIDWSAAEANCAFLRFFKPVRIFMLGDHVDFAAFSRFDKPPSDIYRIQADVEACGKYLRMIRESAPDARIHYLKGNHEQRFERFLWKNETAAALLKAQGMELPTFLGLGDVNVEWVESGSLLINDLFMAKHGHMVRQRAGYTATGELERNGISGMSGHTHRLGQIFKRSRVGSLTWVESGCTCLYDPSYMEGQVSDWQQGLSFGTVSLRGNGFSVHVAPIIKGRVKALGKEIGP